ncbi:putative type-1 restriction enzyme specificity protein MG438 [subsurface metagenome]
MEVKEGYKQTEVGVIPEDWVVKELDVIGSFKKGKGIRKDEVVSDGIPCVRYGELYTLHHEYIKGFSSFISSESAKKSQKLNKGDLLFAGSGETKEEIGKCAAFLDDREAYAGGDVIILSPRKTNPLLLGFILNHELVVRQKAQLAQGDAIVHIYPNNLSRISVPLPPTKAEQTAIAAALSDADALIQSLEKLIAKKRSIKQGAMQELLKPKEGWVVEKLGEIAARITTGKLDANAMVENGEYRFYTCAKEFYHIDHFAFNTEALLVSGNGANVGYIHYYKGKFNAYQRTYILTDFSKDIFYVKLYMDSYLKNRIVAEVNAGNTPYIKMDTLTEMVIHIPKEKSEQIRIAAILSDMDAEIAALEAKLAKYKQIKQGMMQELLTGRIRLV